MTTTHLHKAVMIILATCAFSARLDALKRHKQDIVVDHTSFFVNDYKQSVKFYDETLALLGIKRILSFNNEGYEMAGYGRKCSNPSFWIGTSTFSHKEELIGKAKGLHVAFRAPSIEAIQEWYKKCLELGGRDNGAPGPRPYYHPGYYSAFIIDPNGWRIEAVLHTYREK